MVKRSRSKSKKRGFGNIGVKLVAIAIIFGLAFLTCRWLYTALEKQREAEGHLQALLAEKAQLERIQIDLQEEKENLLTSSYIEELAREQLGLVRKGEILVAPREGG
jgi:cell division protein DivIC